MTYIFIFQIFNYQLSLWTLPVSRTRRQKWPPETEVDCRKRRQLLHFRWERWQRHLLETLCHYWEESVPKAAKNLPIITLAITTTIILCQKYYKFGTQTCIKVRKYQKHFFAFSSSKNWIFRKLPTIKKHMC